MTERVITLPRSMMALIKKCCNPLSVCLSVRLSNRLPVPSPSSATEYFRGMITIEDLLLEIESTGQRRRTLQKHSSGGRTSICRRRTTISGAYRFATRYLLPFAVSRIAYIRNC